MNSQVRKTIEEFLEESKATKETRIKELEVLIPEAIKRSMKLQNLEACSEDANRMTRFLIETIGVKPEHIILMMM